MPPPKDNIPLADVKPHPAPPEPGSHPVNRAFDFILLIGFLALITIPLVGFFITLAVPTKLAPPAADGSRETIRFHLDFYDAKAENRELADFPERPKTYHDFTHYSDHFFDFFKDHFGFRNTLIHGLGEFRYQAHLVDNNDQVIVGKDNFLFLSVRKDQVFRRERGFSPFTELELEQWQQLLEKRAVYFKSRNIAYVAFFAPDKQTIYPEMLPDDLVTHYPTRLDQLQQRLAETHSPVVLVDVRNAVRDAKKNGPVFFHTDTHWNAYGAYAAYRLFLAAAQKQLPQFDLAPQPLSNFLPDNSRIYSGDLVGMLGLDRQLSENYLNLVPKTPYRDNPATRDSQYNPKAPTLVMFHDSFGNFLPNFVGPNFHQSYFRFTDSVEIEPLDTLKPDLVITELVERKLYAFPPPDPAPIAKFPLPTP